MIWRVVLLVLLCHFYDAEALAANNCQKCDSNAQCIYSSRYGSSYKCNKGYTGNGDTCTVTAKNESSQIMKRCEVARQSRTACVPDLNVTESECLSMDCCWDSTHDDSENVTHCYHSAVAMSRFKTNVGNDQFCPASNGTYLLGDVNGDGLKVLSFSTDQMCWKNSNDIEIRIGNNNDGETVSSGPLQGCSGQGDVVKTGDVNGDGKSDIVCVTQTGGVMVWISKDENSQFFDSQPWNDDHFGFCLNHPVLVSDFNGDGSADLLCAPETAEEKRSLALGDKSGTFMAPVTDPNFQDFCTGTDDQLKLGDFDADGRTDLVCRVSGGEKYQIGLSDGDGLMVNEDFKTEASWCDQSGDTFLVGDFNGNHHDDWMCRNDDGRVCVKYNSLAFADANMFNLESCDEIGVCTDCESHVGDENGDGIDDLYQHCEDGTTCVATATVKAPKVDFLQIDWDSDVSWNGTMFCKDKELYVGDVNGDKKQDVVCHENKGGLIQRILGNHYGQLIYSDKWTSFKDPDNVGRFCHRTHENPEYPQRLKGDADGDGRMDMLCHSPLTGDVDVSKADTNGEFDAGLSLKSSFCQGQEARVTAADFDADKKVDLMCQTSTETKIWLQGGEEESLMVDSTWCGELFDEILIGRFVDGRSEDLICHNRDNGAKSVLHMAPGRQSVTEDVLDHIDWCLSKDNKQLKAGDFNGDKLTDLLCHNQTGEMKVLLNQGEHKSNSGWFGEEFTADVKFCSEPGSTLSVFDANDDGYDDLTCHESTGRITISESHLVEQGHLSSSSLGEADTTNQSTTTVEPVTDTTTTSE